MPLPIAALATGFISRMVVRRSLIQTFTKFLGRGSGTRISTTYPQRQIDKLHKAKKSAIYTAEGIAEDAARVAVDDVQAALRNRLHRPTEAFLNTITARTIDKGSQIVISERWAQDIMRRLIYGGTERATSDRFPLVYPIDLPLDSHGNIVGYHNGRLFRIIDETPDLFIVPLSQVGTDGRDLSHLAPGIWDSSGERLRPRAFFLWKRSYRPILPWEDIGTQALMKAIDRNAVTQIQNQLRRIR